jgi:hypothetical protein
VPVARIPLKWVITMVLEHTKADKSSTLSPDLRQDLRIGQGNGSEHSSLDVIRNIQVKQDGKGDGSTVKRSLSLPDLRQDSRTGQGNGSERSSLDVTRNLSRETKGLVTDGSILSLGAMPDSQRGGEKAKADDRGTLPREARSSSLEKQNANPDKERLKAIILKHVLNYDENEKAGANKPPDQERRLQRAESRRKSFEKEFEYYSKEDARYHRAVMRLEKFYRTVDRLEKSQITFGRLIDVVKKRYFKRLDKRYITKTHHAFEERRAHIERNSRKYFGFFRPHYRFNWERMRTQHFAKKLVQMDAKIGMTRASFRETLEEINQKKINELKKNKEKYGMTDGEIAKHEIDLRHRLNRFLAEKEQEWRMSETQKIMGRPGTVKDLAFTNQWVSVLGYAASIAIAGAAL